MNRCILLCVLGAPIALTLACEAALPVAPAPLEKGELVRAKTEMIVSQTQYEGKKYEQVSFRSGAKSVLVSGVFATKSGFYTHRRPVCYGAIYVDGERENLGYLYLSCGNEWKPSTSEPGDRTVVDRERQTVTWCRPYVLPDKTSAEATYTVSILSDGRLAVDYDFGVDEARAASFTSRLPFAARLSLESYEEGTRAYGFGESVHEPVADERIEAEGRKFVRTSGGKLTTPVLNVERHDPLKAWSIEFPSVAVAERFLWDDNHTTMKDDKRIRNVSLRDSDFGCLQKGNPGRCPTKGRFVIDLGKSAVPRVPSQPMVGGIDFWRNDALHVPIRPTRNQLVNGSFEQGLKGWRWEDWGARWSPAEKPREEIVSGGYCGDHALLMRANMPKAPALCSQTMSLEAEKPHILSFYARHNCDKAVALSVKPQTAKTQGRYFALTKGGSSFEPVQVKPGDWQRFEIPFTPDKGGIYVKIAAPYGTKDSEMLIDGVQVEQGTAATVFVDDPFQATLRTSRYPFNDLRPGDDYGLELDVVAHEGAKGCVRVRIENFYNEVKFDRTFDLAGSTRIPLPVDPSALGLGIFVIRMDYALAGIAYTDYARFSVLRPLANKHATAQFYANHPNWFVRSSRLPDVMRKYVEWGWGSLAGVSGEITLKKMPWHEQMSALGIRNYIHNMSEEIENGGTGIKHRPEFAEFAKCYPGGWSGYRKWKTITPEALEFIEAAAYQVGLETDCENDIFAFAGEEEGWVRDTIGWEAHWSCVEAMMKGAKRAFAERGLPPPKFVSSQGTSHYFAGRNYDAIDGFLGTAAKHGVKYDAVSIHPYSNIDTGILGPHDADKETQHLLEQMKSYGYDEKTPVYFAECFNMMPWNIPEWGCVGWGDNFRRNKAPTQARGVRECTMAGAQARLYLLALKFWPQVCLVHAWNCEPFLDVDLAPLSHILAANTLGNVLPDPEYVGGVQPYGDVRGLCFRRKDRGDYLMAVWTTNHEVEFGERKSPILDMKLPDDVRFVDFEGNERTPSAKQIVTVNDGRHTLVPLTPAPLFLISKDSAALLDALKNAVADDPAMALEAEVKPDLMGTLNLSLRNLTSLRRSGEVVAGEKTIAYNLPPRGAKTYPIVKGSTKDMKENRWKGNLLPLFKKPMNVAWFRIPRCGKKPNWSKVPTLPFTACSGKAKGGKVKACAKYAWNKDFLFMRVEVEDPEFVPVAESGKKFSPTALYAHDGSLEVYFDGFGNARTQGERGYDDDDSRYDLIENHVHRLRAVNMQLAQGTSSATDTEVSEKLVRSFTRTATGYVYEVAFAARYMAPVDLKVGTVFGTGVALHDFTKGVDGKELCTTISMSVDPDRDLNDKPFLLPLAILGE